MLQMEKNNEIIITKNEMQTSKLSIHEEKHMKSSKKKLIMILLSIIIAVMAACFLILPACAIYYTLPQQSMNQCKSGMTQIF